MIFDLIAFVWSRVWCMLILGWCLGFPYLLLLWCSLDLDFLQLFAFLSSTCVSCTLFCGMSSLVEAAATDADCLWRCCGLFAWAVILIVSYLRAATLTMGFLVVFHLSCGLFEGRHLNHGLFVGLQPWAVDYLKAVTLTIGCLLVFHLSRGLFEGYTF